MFDFLVTKIQRPLSKCLEGDFFRYDHLPLGIYVVRHFVEDFVECENVVTGEIVWFPPHFCVTVLEEK